MKFYKIGESLNRKERESLGLKRAEFHTSLDLSPKDVRAVFSGDKRNPRKGEWYLSGDPILAYRAPNDYATPYHIAKIVRVREVKKFIIEKTL